MHMQLIHTMVIICYWFHLASYMSDEEDITMWIRMVHALRQVINCHQLRLHVRFGFSRVQRPYEKCNS